jgi:hypothetical protein
LRNPLCAAAKDRKSLALDRRLPLSVGPSQEIRTRTENSCGSPIHLWTFIDGAIARVIQPVKWALFSASTCSSCGKIARSAAASCAPENPHLLNKLGGRNVVIDDHFSLKAVISKAKQYVDEPSCLKPLCSNGFTQF